MYVCLTVGFVGLSCWWWHVNLVYEEKYVYPIQDYVHFVYFVQDVQAQPIQILYN